MFEIKRASRETIPEILRFQSEAFGLPVQHFQELIERDPWFEPENILVLLSHGKLVSSLQIFPKPVRIGGASARMGGVGNVVTHPRYRGRGHATRLLKETIQLMRDEGYGFSVLFTKIPDFYRRLKWEVASPRYKYVISATEASGRNSNNLQVAPLRVNDLDAVAGLYETTNKRRTLSVLRSKECWHRQLDHRLDETARSVVIKRGKHALVYGRYRTTWRRVWVTEAGCSPGPDSRATLQELLTFVGNHALREGRSHISVYVPPDNPLVREVLARGGRDETKASSGLMVRVISLRSLLDDILPELNTRVSDQLLSGRIRIQTEEEAVPLVIRSGEIKIATQRKGDEIYKVGNRVLAQHLTGYLTPLQALERGLARAKPSVAKLVDALFKPKRPPHFWRYDRF
jgi:predicted acetyltransferase